MAARNLTNQFVESVKPGPDGRQVEYPDAKVPGLALRVSTTAKAWVVRYRNSEGVQKRLTLGRFPALSLTKARERALQTQAAVSAGGDPASEKRRAKTIAAARTVRSLNDLADEYFERAKVGKHKAKGRPKRASTLALDKGRYDKHIRGKLGKLDFREIARADVRSLVDSKSAATGNGCLAVIRQVYSYAIYTERTDRNPAIGIGGQTLNSRDRVLRDEEFRTFWKAAADPASVKPKGRKKSEPPTWSLSMSKPVGIALRLAAVTLQRLNEVVGMQEDELDLTGDMPAWTIPADRTKNGRIHIVPLSQPAVELIKEARALRDTASKASKALNLIPEEAEVSAVFPSPNNLMQPMKRHSLTRAMARLCKATELKDITAHDLRRTGATAITSERIGMNRFVVSQVLNHVSDKGGGGGATPVYDRHEYLAEKRRALNAWADRLAEIVEGRDRSSNIVALNA